MNSLPEFLRIGGNEKHGAVAIIAQSGNLQVIEYPTGNPLDGSRVLLEVLDIPYNRQQLTSKWDGFKLKSQMISHLGLDVIKIEPGELDE